jgi:restriction system protein
MAIPDYQSCMLPLLALASDGQGHGMAEAVEKLSAQFKLTEAERAELLPSLSASPSGSSSRWATAARSKKPRAL